MPRLGFVIVLVALSPSACARSVNESRIPSPAETRVLSSAVPLPPGSGDIVNQRFAAPLTVDDAERILTETEIFAYDVPSRGVQAYNRVFDQPDDRARYERVLARGRFAGQLYALCGLGPLNPKATAVAARLAKVDEKIWVFQSDQANELPVSTVIATLQRNPQISMGLRRLAQEANRRFDPAGWLQR